MLQNIRMFDIRSFFESLVCQKFLLIICLVIFSSGVIIAENADRLFPSIPAAVFIICSISMAYVLKAEEFDRQKLLCLLGIIILFSITVRIYIYTFPVSMIGYDPDTLAIAIGEIINKGYVEDSLTRFYSNAPIFHIFIAIVSLVTNSTPAEAMTVLPLLVGLIFPLTAFIYSTYILKEASIGLVAAILSAVLANSVSYSYIPIPQVVSTVLFLLLCMSLIRYLMGKTEHICLIIIFILALIFTHKLHPLIVSGTILSTIFIERAGIVKNKYLSKSNSSNTIILSVVFTIIFIVWAIVVFKPSPQLVVVGGVFTLVSLKKMKKSNGIIDTSEGNYRTNSPLGTSHYLILFGISTTLLFTQWTVTTQLINRVIYGIQPLFVSTATTTSTQTSQNFQSIDRGLMNIFFHQSDILIVVLLTSFAWLFIFYHFDFEGVPSSVMLAGSSVPLALLPFALYTGAPGPSGINATRILLAFSPIAIALLAVFLFRYPDKYIIPVAIILLLLQVFSAGFVPDAYETRSYLSETEVSGKTFNTIYVSSPVYSDEFYASESVSPVIGYTHQEETVYISFDWEILANQNTILQYRYISLRTDTSLFVHQPGYDSVVANSNTDYNKYYSNGGVNSYILPGQ